jgi:glycosyltransferase involved in cell wall biosynthesis
VVAEAIGLSRKCRSVLLATWGFPPYTDVSALRTAKFCRFLPRFGWHPIVFTAPESAYGSRRHPEMPRELHGHEIHRFRFPVFPGSIFLAKLLFPILVVRFAWRERARLHAVYLDAGPFHPLLAVPFLARFLRVPVVIDLRDSWSMNPVVDRAAPALLRPVLRRIRHAVEWCGIRFGARVICATSVLAEEYQRAFPGAAAKIATIPNGFDPEEFEGISPVRATSGRSLVLTGKFLFYTPEVARALMRLLREHPDLVFVYAGGEAREIRALADSEGVLEQTRIHDYLPRGEMLARIAGCDFGLATTELVNGLGTKIFD